MSTFRGFSPRLIPGQTPALGGILLALAACGGEGASAARGGLDGPDAEIRPPLEEVFRVGTVAGDDWESFSQVPNVAFDAASNLYVFDPENARVIVVDPSGSFVRQIGAPGEGPGELRRPLAMSVHRDGTVAILDLGHQSWVVYPPEGEPRMVRASLEDGVPNEGIHPHPDGGMVAAGVGIRVRMSSGGPPQLPSDERPSFIPIRRFTLDGEAPQVIHQAWRPPEAGGTEEETRFQQGEGRTMAVRMAPMVGFDPEPLLAVLPDGRMALADSTTYRVTLLDAAGSEVGVLERPISPTPVTPEIQGQERENRLAALEESGGPRMMMVGPGGTSSIPGMQDMMRQRIETMLFRDEIPVVAALASDWAGMLWVGRSGSVGESGPVDLVRPEGDYLGTIPAEHMEMPDAFGPDGLMAWIELDEFDVPSVVVRRMDAPEAGG